MNFANKIKKDNSGVTLIEVIIVFLIFIAIFDVAWMFYKNSINSNDVLTENLNAQEEARKSFIEMTAAIRSASPSATGAYTIYSASSTAFIFYSDIDYDGAKEQVRYFLSGNILKKGITEPSGSPLSYPGATEKITSLIRNVVRDDSQPLFSYYDGDYSGTEDPLSAPVNILNIRLIKITVLVDRDPKKSPTAAEFTTQVSIRNLKDNL